MTMGFFGWWWVCSCGGGGAFDLVLLGSGAVVNEFWIRGKRERGILGFEKLNDFLLDVYSILMG